LYFPFHARKNNVDVILVDGGSIWSPFFVTLKLFGIPLILDIRDIPIDKEHKILKDISLHLSRYLMDGFTTISPELSEILTKKYHLHGKKIGIWSSAVSKQMFLELNKQTDTLHKKDADSFILIYHGTYAPTRGIENLIRSIGELADPLKNNIKLFLIGMPQHKTKDLTLLCEDLKITKQVEIISLVENTKIPFYIQASDVGIIPLPPDKEWWRVSVPLKSLEYLALGKPIIATSIPFHQKIFHMGECGIIIDSNEPKDIADAITYLNHNKDKLNEMGRRGKEIIKNYYTWEHKALEVECFLKTVLADK
jgi:glycosyltransferase involved in cell wall biosynthesis